jgi:hypothetical protein
LLPADNAGWLSATASAQLPRRSIQALAHQPAQRGGIAVAVIVLPGAVHGGVGPFSHPRNAPDKWVVNLRCVDGADLSTQVIQCFDGRHWEQAVAALMGKRGSR